MALYLEKNHIRYDIAFVLNNINLKVLQRKVVLKFYQNTYSITDVLVSFYLN